MCVTINHLLSKVWWTYLLLLWWKIHSFMCYLFLNPLNIFWIKRLVRWWYVAFSWIYNKRAEMSHIPVMPGWIACLLWLVLHVLHVWYLCLVGEGNLHYLSNQFKFCILGEFREKNNCYKKNLKAYSLMSNRGHSENFQNLNFLHISIVLH